MSIWRRFISSSEDNEKKLIWLYSYVRPYLPNFLFTVFLVVLTNGMLLWFGTWIRDLVDLDTAILAVGQSFSYIFHVLIVIGIFSGMMFFRMLIMNYASDNIVYDVRSSIFSKLMKQSILFFDKRSSADLASMIITDTEILHEVLQKGIIMFNRHILVSFGGSIMLLFINIKLTIIFAISVPMILFVLWVLSRSIRKISLSISNGMGSLSGFVNEKLSSIRTVKLFVQEGLEAELFSVKAKKVLYFRHCLSILRSLMVSTIFTCIVLLYYGCTFSWLYRCSQ